MKVLLILGAACIAVAYNAGTVANNKSYGGISPYLNFIVTVDGKSYFTDSIGSRNWTQASTYCKGLGMRLASITSADQFQALSNASVKEFNTGFGYWTSGRDSQQVRQFTWNNTNAPLVAPFFPFKELDPLQYLTCVMFDKRAGNGSYLTFTPCSKSWRVLCETL